MCGVIALAHDHYQHEQLSVADQCKLLSKLKVVLNPICLPPQVNSTKLQSPWHKLDDKCFNAYHNWFR